MTEYTKTVSDYFADWEGNAFGFGYGTGEQYTLPALKQFLSLYPAEGACSHQALENSLGPVVAWLLINTLCRHPLHILEYGTSPRFTWLTEEGKRLKVFVDGQPVEALYELTAGRDENYVTCYPDACNCGPNGYDESRICANPFWKGWAKKRV